MNNENLEIFTVNTDEGCGIIRRGVQNLLPFVSIENLTYQFLEENRGELLNLISIEQFNNWLKNK